jgi:hypothetical protein
MLRKPLDRALPSPAYISSHKSTHTKDLLLLGREPIPPLRGSSLSGGVHGSPIGSPNVPCAPPIHVSGSPLGRRSLCTAHACARELDEADEARLCADVWAEGVISASSVSDMSRWLAEEGKVVTCVGSVWAEEDGALAPKERR